MEYLNKLSLKTFKQFYSWLKENHNKECECWIHVNRGKPNKTCIWYIDAVYAALSFGWIDSIFKNIDGKTYQKFSPRSKKTNWTQLNIERCNWLIKNNLMDESGLKLMPKAKYVFDKDVLDKLKKDKDIWNNFKHFPPLYQRIRVFNVASYKKDKQAYTKALNNLIKHTKANKMYGKWDDNGRLQ